MVEAASEAFSGGNCSCFPLDGFWRDGIVFVAKPIREEQMQEEDLRCSRPHISSTTSLLLPEYI